MGAAAASGRRRVEHPQYTMSLKTSWNAPPFQQARWQLRVFSEGSSRQWCTLSTSPPTLATAAAAGACGCTGDLARKGSVLANPLRLGRGNTRQLGIALPVPTECGPRKVRPVPGRSRPARAAAAEAAVAVHCDPVRAQCNAFPCASAVVLPKADVFACRAAASSSRTSPRNLATTTQSGSTAACRTIKWRGW